ncbi:MAG: Na+/H+ antiporter subunit E [Acidobacteriota bacterium]|nr:Na+/H+ antiporter subunit E [Acidobacteriota bacterium]
MKLIRFLRIALRLLLFLPGYLRDIVRSNLRVAHDVLTPTHLMSPTLAWLSIEHDLADWQVLLVANLVTMTPGTICLEYDPDRRALLVHLMYRDEVDQVKAEVTRISAIAGGM